MEGTAHSKSPWKYSREKKYLHHPGIEPEAPAWQAEILPLNQWCCARFRKLCNIKSVRCFYEQYGKGNQSSALHSSLITLITLVNESKMKIESPWHPSHIGKTLAVIRGHRHLSSIHLTCYGVTHGYAVFVSDESQNFDTERITHGAHPLWYLSVNPRLQYNRINLPDSVIIMKQSEKDFLVDYRTPALYMHNDSPVRQKEPFSIVSYLRIDSAKGEVHMLPRYSADFRCKHLQQY